VHINCAESGFVAVEADVTASVDRLTEILGRSPRYLAYPLGPTSAAAGDVVKRHGFSGRVHAGAPAPRPIPVRACLDPSQVWFEGLCHDLWILVSVVAMVGGRSRGRAVANVVRPILGKRR
jgi:peptidoglycan/xylan/chitin deacetylase (PgdA/CDA1 family)